MNREEIEFLCLKLKEAGFETPSARELAFVAGAHGADVLERWVNGLLEATSHLGG